MRLRTRKRRQHTIGLGTERLEERQMLDGSGIPAVMATVEPAEKTPVGQTRIVGGNEVQEDEPWMVALQSSSGSHFCGGSLVAPDVVVTAAHCVEGESAATMQVELGLHRLSDNGEVHQIDQIIMHPQYDTVAIDSDIALLLLSTPSSRETIRLAQPEDSELERPGTLVTTMGWGTTQSAEPSDPIREVEVPIVSRAVANAPSSYNGDITENMLAAGVTGKDSCQGDSGGPLFTQDSEGDDVLVGIVSWGTGCGDAGFPGIYTRVSMFAEWASNELLVAPAASVSFTSDEYSARSSAFVRLTDSDLAGTGTAQVRVTSSNGDSENFDLTESTSGRFSGRVSFGDSGTVTTNDGVLDIVEGATIEVTYEDSDDGTGNSVSVTDSASIIADDHGDAPDTATPISIGTQASGVLQFAGDIDTFSFEATAGTQYRIAVNLDGTLSDSVLDLVTADNGLLANNDDSGAGLASTIIWTANQDETVYAKVLGYNNDQGSYSLVVTEEDGTVASDDHGDDADSATAIEIDSLTPGTIGDSDTDWFSFDVEPGTTISLEVQLGTLDDSVVELRDSDGTLIAEDDDGGDDLGSLLTYEITEGGTYYAVVEPFLSEQGSYNLIVTADGATLDDLHGDEAATATPITAGSTTTGFVSDPDTDWFSFDVAVDDSVELEVLLGTLTDSTLALYSEDGTLLAEDDNGGIGAGSALRWEATEAGTYYAVVAPQSAEHEGSYTLLFDLPTDNDDHGDNAGGATAVANNSSTQGELGESDTDWFAISVEEGATLDIEITLGTLFDSVLEIWNSSGDLIAQDDDGGTDLGSRLLWTAPQAGTYYAVVTPYSFDYTGSYTLVVQEQADDHGNSASTATAVELGSTTAGELSQADVDWFSFSVAPDTSIQIDVTHNSLVESRLELRDESGNLITSQSSFQEGPSLDWPQLEGGTYYAVVWPEFFSEGTYEISISSIDQFTQIEVPGTVSSSTEAGEVFVFEGQAGTRYVAFTTLGTLSDSTLSIDAIDGTFSEFNDDVNFDGLESRIEFVAPTTTTYIVVVEGYDGATGTFDLDIVEDDYAGDHQAATFLPLNTSVSGGIDFAGDDDIFEFEAGAGRAYYFELNGLSENAPETTQPELRIWSSDGQTLLDRFTPEVVDGAFSAGFSWISPEDGDYFVEVSDRETSTYELSSTIVFGDANLDGVFSSADIVAIFRAGEYNDDLEDNSTWVTGDWSGDNEFDSTDLVIAFTLGTYIG